MKLGLLGCGSVAYWLHLRALRAVPDATLVAAADPDPAARARFAKASGVTACERAEDLLGRRDIDAVLICAPTHLHASLACAAAAAGKHFYLEKPIAASLDDARHVVATAAQAGITTAIGFNRRHHPLFERVRDLLTQGIIGRVHAVQTTFCEPSPPERMPEWKRRRATGGGVLLDLASHHIDQVRWMLATEVDVAYASVHSEVTEQDRGRLELTTEGGASIQSFFSFRDGPAEQMDFIGERGTLRLDRHAATLTLSRKRSRGYGASHRQVGPSPSLLRWVLERTWRRSVDPSYRRALVAFVEQVRGGPPGTAALQDGLRSLEVVVAAEAFAAETCASF